MTVQDLTDDDLMSYMTFAESVMETDSQVEDVLIEFEDMTQFTYPELLEEASRRAEKT